MRARVSLLLLLAALSGSLAGAVATAGTDAAAARPAQRLPALEPVPDGPRCPIPPRYRGAFETAARDTRLPLALLVAVGEVESNLRHEAVSDAGARGILQVMPATARELALDVDRPATNVLAGARYLRRMLDRFESSDLALAAYNAGPTAVARAGGAPGGETLSYVANVTARWRTLNGCR